MNARYLIRMDDACPTMDSRKWQMFEDLFDNLGIKPLVAVVPDNCDPELQCDPPDVLFWEKVRCWQAKDWTIALHGYKHQFHFVDRKRLVLPFYDRSEFGGLTLSEQSSKLRDAWELFQGEGVEPNVWIAPAHCFDRLTLEALRNETTIRIVSDGIAWDQYHEEGFTWVPQQLWELVPRWSGLWTVCLHPNTMSYEAIEKLKEQLLSPYFEGRIVSLADVELTERQKGLTDVLYGWYFWNRIRIYEALFRVRSMLRCGK